MSDHQVPPKTYLGIEDQIRLTRQIAALRDQSHWTEYFFLKYSAFIASGALALSGLSMWHAGYVAWNINNYSKGRLPTFLIACGFFPAGGLLHELEVKKHLGEPFRKENKWYYGMRAVIANQVCLLIQAGFSIGYSFTAAQMTGIIPIENEYFNKKRRANTLKFMLSRLSPFKRRLVAVNVLSSALLFFAGARSYTESCQLLAKVGRKTVSEIED